MAANLAQEAALAAAPQATKERDLAYQALKTWMSEYRAFAKAQIEDRPRRFQAAAAGVKGSDAEGFALTSE